MECRLFLDVVVRNGTTHLKEEMIFLTVSIGHLGCDDRKNLSGWMMTEC